MDPLWSAPISVWDAPVDPPTASAALTSLEDGAVVFLPALAFRPLPEEAFAYGYQAEMRHFVECVRDGKTPRETYEDGYVVNCVLAAGYQSMQSGRWTRVKYRI